MQGKVGACISWPSGQLLICCDQNFLPSSQSDQLPVRRVCDASCDGIETFAARLAWSGQVVSDDRERRRPFAALTVLAAQLVHARDSLPSRLHAPVEFASNIDVPWSISRVVHLFTVHTPQPHSSSSAAPALPCLQRSSSVPRLVTTCVTSLGAPCISGAHDDAGQSSERRCVSAGGVEG